MPSIPTTPGKPREITAREREEATRILDAFFKLDDPKEEWKLFWGRNALDEKSWINCLLSWKGAKEQREVRRDHWIRRFRQWEKHLEVHYWLNVGDYSGDELKQRSQESSASEADGSGGSSTPQVPKPEDPARAHEDAPATIPGRPKELMVPSSPMIEKLNGALTILDQKIGMTLAVNSLLLGAAISSLSWIASILNLLHCSVHQDFYTNLFHAEAFFVIFCCLTSLWFSLRGFRRVVWGDLGKPEEGRTRDNLSQKGNDYVYFLIISVARRTNMFRVSTEVTRWALIGFILLATTSAICLFGRGQVCSALNRQEGHEPGPYYGEVGIKTPINSGKGTSSGVTAVPRAQYGNGKDSSLYSGDTSGRKRPVNPGNGNLRRKKRCCSCCSSSAAPHL